MIDASHPPAKAADNTDLANEARAEALRLIAAGDNTDWDRSTRDRFVSQAQVWATLSVSYELSRR